MANNVSRPRFPERKFGFNPKKDIQSVEQFGFVNLAECYEKGILPSSVELTDENFNGVETPGTLISRSSDVFDGLRKREYVSSVLSKLNAEEREKAQNAMARQAEKEGIVHVNVSSEG